MARSAWIALWVVATSSEAALADPEKTAQAKAKRRQRVTWQWPKFHPAEYAATGVLFASAFGIRFGVPQRADPNWTNGIPPDDWFFEHVYPNNPRVRDTWKIAGDVAFTSSFLWSLADPLIAGGTHDWTVGSQMLLMNLEAYATYSMLLWGSQYLIRQRRPRDRPCDGHDGPGSNDRCDTSGSVRAFIGGHVGAVTTAASLTCLHHTYMPLYGGGWRDAFPCALWIGGTMVTFTARTITGSHYLSDNLFGLGIGGFSGWIVPWTLHYLRGPKPYFVGSKLGPRLTAVSFAPSQTGEGGALTFGGTW
jgi:hypothetical protein